MTLEEKLQQIQLLSDGQIKDDDARKGVGGVFSLADPAKINHFQHIAVEQSRLHIPILFAFDTIHGFRTIFPIPLGAASSFDPDVADDRRHDRRARVRGGRDQADLQPDGRRLARAALGPHLRGRGRGPVPRLRVRRRAREGARRAATTARPTRSSRASSTTPPTASPRAAATTTRPTCPSSGCATSTCRRSRRRSTPARTPSMCSFNAINGVPGLRELRDSRPTSSSASGASTASSRATTPPSPSCAPARRKTPDTGRAATASRPTARTRRAWR